jgi:hypothetical protein
MGRFKSSWALASAAWAALALIFTANLLLLGSQMAGISHIGSTSSVTLVLTPASQHSIGGRNESSIEEGLGPWVRVGPGLRPGQYLDGVMALAWQSPLRFILMLAFVVGCAAFLALVS